MRTSTASLSTLVAIGLFLVASYAVAQVATSDQITISANDRTASEFGTSFNPLTLQSFPEGGGENLLNYFVGFRASTPTNPHGQTFNAAVVLTEPNGGISDIVEFSIVATFDTLGNPLGQNWTLNFFSDTEAGGLSLSTLGVSLPGTGSCPQNGTAPESCANPVPETGILQDISGLLLNSDGVSRITPLFTVNVQSDLEPVPEPSTLVLLGSGLAGLAGTVWGRRRRK